MDPSSISYDVIPLGVLLRRSIFELYTHYDQSIRPVLNDPSLPEAARKRIQDHYFMTAKQRVAQLLVLLRWSRSVDIAALSDATIQLSALRRSQLLLHNAALGMKSLAWNVNQGLQPYPQLTPQQVAMAIQPLGNDIVSNAVAQCQQQQLNILWRWAEVVVTRRLQAMNVGSIGFQVARVQGGDVTLVIPGVAVVDLMLLWSPMGPEYCPWEILLCRPVGFPLSVPMNASEEFRSIMTSCCDEMAFPGITIPKVIGILVQLRDACLHLALLSIQHKIENLNLHTPYGFATAPRGMYPPSYAVTLLFWGGAVHIETLDGRSIVWLMSTNNNDGSGVRQSPPRQLLHLDVIAICNEAVFVCTQQKLLSLQHALLASSSSSVSSAQIDRDGTRLLVEGNRGIKCSVCVVPHSGLYQTSVGKKQLFKTETETVAFIH
eukprot:PhF_6_TR3677/c0_g1_i1/m.5215